MLWILRLTESPRSDDVVFGSVGRARLVHAAGDAIKGHGRLMLNIIISSEIKKLLDLRIFQSYVATKEPVGWADSVPPDEYTLSGKSEIYLISWTRVALWHESLWATYQTNIGSSSPLSS